MECDAIRAESDNLLPKDWRYEFFIWFYLKILFTQIIYQTIKYKLNQIALILRWKDTSFHFEGVSDAATLYSQASPLVCVVKLV